MLTSFIIFSEIDDKSQTYFTISESYLYRRGFTRIITHPVIYLEQLQNSFCKAHRLETPTSKGYKRCIQ